MKKGPSPQFLLMQKGESYHFDDYLLKLQRKCFRQLTAINRLPFDHPRRQKLMERLLGSCGSDNIIKQGFCCNFGFNIFLGSNCYINYDVRILDSCRVDIGNNVFIGPGVVISPVTHPLQAEHRRELIVKRITIEDDVWIGANATVLPGITLHRGCVIGAGAVVTKDVAAYEVVAGVPAKHMKTITPEGEKQHGQ